MTSHTITFSYDLIKQNDTLLDIKQKPLCHFYPPLSFGRVFKKRITSRIKSLLRCFDMASHSSQLYGATIFQWDQRQARAWINLRTNRPHSSKNGFSLLWIWIYRYDALKPRPYVPQFCTGVCKGKKDTGSLKHCFIHALLSLATPVFMRDTKSSNYGTERTNGTCNFPKILGRRWRHFIKHYQAKPEACQAKGRCKPLPKSVHLRSFLMGIVT